MAALIQLSVQYGSGSGSSNDSQTGIDLISADNGTNSLSNRQANPITVGTKSYEKWVRLKIHSAPSNGVSNFKIWGDGAVDQSTTLFFTANYITYQQGTTSASTIANTSFTRFTAATPATWDATTYSQTNSYTRYVVFQLDVGATAGPGNWTQETVNYSYDET